MSVLERFLEYVSYETTAGEKKEDSCSNPLMLNLADLLIRQLMQYSPSSISVNRYGIIDAKFDGEGESVAFLAHMDTSDQASGKDVKAKVVEYQGGDIRLSDERVLSEEEYPSLTHSIGHRLVVTDGTTLLGGDDKAGITIIMEALDKVLKGKHKPLEIIFTTDEEIGADAEHVSMYLTSSKYGYTVDGGDYRFASIESFTAYSMRVDVDGISIHPGSGKDKLVNASNVLIEFQTSLPEYLRPEHTADREPFYHLCEFVGREDHATGDYIIRAFDGDTTDKMIDLAKLTARRINDRLGYEAVHLTFKESYRNMAEVLKDRPEITEELENAYRKANLPFSYEAIRGGTTGSQLSFKGMPCPNIGTGDYNCHGRYEYVDLDEAEKMVEVVVNLMQ